MKKRVSILGVIGLIVALVFSSGSACSAKKMKVPKMIISTGSAGAGWYMMSSTLADWVNAKIEGYPITAVPGAGSMGNPARVTRGEADFGVSYGPILVMARKGEPPFQEEYTNLRAMFSLTANTHHFFISKSLAEKTGAKTLKDIVDQKIGLKMGSAFPGASDALVLEAIFEELGVSYKTIGKWGGTIQLIGTSGRVALWKDRHIDGFHSLIEFPAAAITEALGSRPGRLLGLTEEIRDMLVKERGFSKTTIPAGTYPGQDYPVPSVKMPMVYFTTVDAPAEVIYLITKTAGESEKRWKDSYGAFKAQGWVPKNMVEGLGIPIHEGAVRYYKEQGWM